MIHKFEVLANLQKKTLGLIFVLGAAGLAFAQEKSSVTGVIKNQDNVPVAYASVTFSNTNNKVYSDAALTDENGAYQLKLMPGTYEVTVESIDYKKATFKKTVTAGTTSGDFVIQHEAQITNSKTQDIQEVTITATNTKPYRVELDKKIYDPSTDIISKGGNLQDVLTNVPSIAVDTDGTVSMRGSSNIKFLINGKPSALLGIDDNANALKSIPADQIERIEVITNPSSKFEASGTAGILNIILKKNKGRGFNGSVTGSLGYQPQTSLNTNLSWKNGAWTYFLNGGGGYSERKFTNNTKTRYFDAAGKTTSFQEQTGENENNIKYYNATTGFNVDITDKTSLNMSGMVRGYNSDGLGTVTYNSFDASRQLLSASQRISNQLGKSLALQGDIGLDHKFNNDGHLITASFSMQKNDSKDNSAVNETESNQFVLSNLIDQKTVNKSIIGKLDYELPLGEQSKLEAGYRLDRNINDYDYAVLESQDGSFFTPLEDFTSNTIYKEVINAVYAQYKSKIGKFGYQLGLRNETTHVKVDFNNAANTVAGIDKQYSGFFPSVFLSYDLGENNNQLLLNYSRRINRPRSWFLVPFSSYNDNRNKFLGNPDLNPEYDNSFELGYAIQKKKFTINPTLYYKRTEGETQMVVMRDGINSENFITKPFNIGNEDKYGLDLNATADLLSWWKIMGSVDLFGYKTTGQYFDADLMTRPLDFSGSGFSTRMRLTNTFKIDKTLSMQLQGFYRGPEKNVSQDRKAMYAVNFGANKSIWNGAGNISFNIQDIFNTRARTVISYGDGFERESFMQWSPRNFSVGFTYRFKQGEKVDARKRSKDINNNSDGGDMEVPM